MKNTIVVTALILGSFVLTSSAFAQDSLPTTPEDVMIENAVQNFSPEEKAAKKANPLPANALCSKTDFKIGGVSDTVKWCIFYQNRNLNPYVVYHLHGLNGSERRWGNNYTKQLMARWTDQGFGQPTVITISFGRLWLLNEAAKNRDRYNLFIKTLIPFLDAKVGRVTAEQRILLGESMGGFNAVQVLLKNPEKFSRFAIHCPAVTTIGPFDPKNIINQFIERTGAKPILVYFTKIVGALTFRKPAEWSHHAPIELSEKAKSLPTKVFLSCGMNDEFGFDEGTEVLAHNLQNKTKELHYVDVPNGHHMDVDVAALSDFMTEDWK